MKLRLVEFKIANYSSAKIQQKKKFKNENLSEELLSWMFILCLHWLCLAFIACSHYPTFSINVKEANKVNVYFHIKIKMYNEHKYQSITAGLTALKHLNPNISETKASVLWLPPQIMNKTYWEWLKHLIQIFIVRCLNEVSGKVSTLPVYWFFKLQQGKTLNLSWFTM